jgi:hypothetical protein
VVAGDGRAMTLLRLLVLGLLATEFVIHARAASTTQVVTPDLAEMVYPSTSTGQSVQFGDPSSSPPSAYELIAPSPRSFTCINAPLCLELQVSSAFESDPFFLSGYDAAAPLTPTAFEGFEASDILPLIPGGPAANSTTWWFQAKGSTASSWPGGDPSAPPAIDLLLRLRQRSQRLSARDQLLVRLRVELVDPRTASSALEAFVVYGSQRVAHSATRVDSKTLRVVLSITRKTQQPDVAPLDAYPLIAAATFASTNDSSSAATACSACFAFLDACRDIPFCKAVVLPCLISYLESMASNDASSGSGSGHDAHTSSSQSRNDDYAGSSRGSDALETVNAGNVGDSDESDGVEAWYADFFSDNGNISRFLMEEAEDEDESTAASLSSSQAAGSGSTGSAGSGQGEVAGPKQVDLLGPLSTCTTDLPRADWAPIRKTLLCLSRLRCALGVVEGEDAGETTPITLALSPGRQQFAVMPTTVGTDNVDMTIVRHDMVSSASTSPDSAYRASASYLELFLRSIVKADVSVLLEPYAGSLNMIHASLDYLDALAPYTLGFSSEGDQLTMIENSPAQVVIEYPASSSRPVLDTLLRQLRARTQPDQHTSHSWSLAPECLACSAQFFGCSTQAVADHSCSYEAMQATFGQCVEMQLPTSLYEAMAQGSVSERPVSAELSRCVANTATSSTDTLHAIMQASSGLACFASTRCPFGPIRVVQDTTAIVLEATSYIQVVRVRLGSSAGVATIKIEYKAANVLIGTSAPIHSTASELETQQAIAVVLASTGIDVSVRALVKATATTEWALEIVYGNVFLPGFAANAVVDEALVKSGAMQQIVLGGGHAELRAVPRDRLKIYREAPPSSSGSREVDPSSSPPSGGSGQGSGSSSHPSSQPTSTSSSGSSSNGNAASGPGSQGPGEASSPSSSGSSLDEGPSSSGERGPKDAGDDSSSGSELGPDAGSSSGSSPNPSGSGTLSP